MENMTVTPFCLCPTKVQRIILEREDAQNYMNNSIHLNTNRVTEVWNLQTAERRL